MRVHLCFTRTIQTCPLWDRAKSPGCSNNGKCVTVMKRFNPHFWNKNTQNQPWEMLFVSARDEINEDHLFGKAMTVKTWRHRIMSAVCTVSGSFTWRFLDRVGLAMMDIVLVIQTLLNCVCVCKPKGCAPQGSVYEKKWFRVNSSDKWHGLSLDGGCAAPRLYMVNLRNLCIKLRWHCILQPRLQEK